MSGLVFSCDGNSTYEIELAGPKKEDGHAWIEEKPMIFKDVVPPKVVVYSY